MTCFTTQTKLNPKLDNERGAIDIREDYDFEEYENEGQNFDEEQHYTEPESDSDPEE